MKVIKFAPGLIPVFKHEEHDQKTHGSWAGVGGMTTEGKNLLRPEQIKDIESALSKIPANHLEALVASGTKVRIMDSPKAMNPEEAPHFHRADNEIRIDKNSGASALLHEIGHALDFNAKSGDGFLSDDRNFRKIIKDSKFPDFSSQRNPFARTEEFAVAYENYYLDGGEFIGAKPTKEFKQVMEGIGQYILSERVAKHGEHDQKTHGNWATGTPTGGNGYDHRQIMSLQRTMGDPLKKAVYDAEANTYEVGSSAPKPQIAERGFFNSDEEYKKAYKEYSKQFAEWAREYNKNIQSDLGEKHLTGKPKGVEEYVLSVVKSDWFIEAFGNGGVLGKLPVKVQSLATANGTYQVGVKNGQGFHALTIDTYSTRNEHTILHEIAHYATAISAKDNYSAHGVEFAKNLLYIGSKVIGHDWSENLLKSYKEKGVDVGN